MSASDTNDRRPAGPLPVLAGGAVFGLGLGYELGWLLSRSVSIDMRVDTSLAVLAGLVIGLAVSAWLVLKKRPVTSGLKAGVGFFAAVGAIPVVPTVFVKYGIDTLGIVLLEGLRLRGLVPVGIAGIAVLALVAGIAVPGAVWYLRWWRAAQRAAAEGGTRKSLVSRTQIVAFGASTAVVLAVYLAVPGVREWVGTALGILARGEVEVVRDYLLGFGVWAPVVSAVLMVLQSIAAPLPAFVITFSNGMLFGWLWGALLSWSSAMAGAAVCFWIARAAGRPVVEKLAGGGHTLDSADVFFERYGDRAVLIARLLPFVSFDIISYAAGLTSMGFWRFFIATGIGQLPATLLYSYLGQNLTGSVRVLFIVFLVTTAIFVAISAARPVFMRRLEARRLAAEGEGTV